MGRPAEKGAGLGWAARALGAFGAWAIEMAGAGWLANGGPGAGAGLGPQCVFGL